MVNTELLQAIERFDLEDYIQGSLDMIKAGNSGDELRVNCFSPNGCSNGDTGHHLYVNIDKKLWHCKKCGYGDSKQQAKTNWLPRFIADAEQISIQAAIDRLLGNLVPTPTDELQDLLEQAFAAQELKKAEESLVVQLPKTFFKLWEKSYVATPYQKYVEERGLSNFDLKQFNIRYCFSKGNKAWASRVVFPVYDLEGVCRSAVGRSILLEPDRRWTNWFDGDLKNSLWPVGSFVKNKWKLLPFTDEIVLTEGVFDALSVNKNTDYKSLCTFGKKVSLGQIETLQKLGIKKVIMGWDHEARKDIGNIVKSLSKYFTVSVFPFAFDLWKNLDFGDCLLKENKAVISVLQEELDNSFSVDSTKFISWLL